MNLLTISDIKFAGSPMKTEDLIKYLKLRMDKMGIKCEMKARKDGIDIIQNSEKLLFASASTNIIPLKEGDPLIQKKGRNYLETQRLTEKQLSALLKIFSLHLDQIHVSCSVKLYPSKEDLNSFVELRDINNKNYTEKWPMPKTFPLERT